MFKKKPIFALMFAALIASFTACSSDKDNGTKTTSKTDIDKGTAFVPAMLGLQPGATISEVGFNWYSKTGSKSVVHIFKGDELVKTATGTSGEILDDVWHKVTVTGLQANTEYTYWVSNDSVNYSNEYTYKTPPAGAFKFAYIGDTQLTSEVTNANGLQDETSKHFSSDRTTAGGWLENSGKIAAEGVSLIVSVGDQVDMSQVGTETYIKSETEYTNFFAPPSMKSIPFAPSVGNHDRHCGFVHHYNIPNEQYKQPCAITTADGKGASNEEGIVEKNSGYYFYLYNNILFVALNTAYYPTSVADATPYVDKFKTTIAAAKAAYPAYTWLIVQHHKSTASVADHIADVDIGHYVDAGFEKVMTDEKVDLVLAGHDHVYARSYVMKTTSCAVNDCAGTVVNTANTNISLAGNPGTIYLTATTGSGLKYYDLFNGSEDLFPTGVYLPSTTTKPNLYVKDNEDYPYLVDEKVGSVAYMEGNLPLSNNVARQHKTPGYTLFDVNGSTITVKTYDVNNTTPIDEFTVTK